MGGLGVGVKNEDRESSSTMSFFAKIQGERIHKEKSYLKLLIKTIL